MTYFHRRPSTIIGAKAFHSPVRDGKVWDHLAMVVKRNWLPSRLLRDAPANWKKHTASDQYGSASSGYEGVERGLRCTSILRSVVNNLTHYNLKGYRIKPHGQLVLVSYMHYCTSTPSLSTSWSRTTLQGGQAPGIPNLQTSFPLRCLQRLSLPYVATRQCHWHDNRYTSGTSTPVLSY